MPRTSSDDVAWSEPLQTLLPQLHYMARVVPVTLARGEARPELKGVLREELCLLLESVHQAILALDGC